MEHGIAVNVLNAATGQTNFHVPVDLAWSVGEESVEKRVLLVPGPNKFTVEVEGEIEGLRIVNLHRVLGRHRVSVR